MNDLDIALFQWMAAGFHPQPALLMLAQMLAVGGATLCAVLLALAAWRQPGARLYLLGALIMASLASLLTHELSGVFGSVRPFAMGLSPQWVVHRASASMPSAHASVMATLAFICMARAGLKPWGAALLALTLAVGWARVYVGVHFPLDIAGGLVLGLLLSGLYQAVCATALHLEDSWMRGPAFAGLPTGAADAAWPRASAQTSSAGAEPAAATLDAVAGREAERASVSCVIPCFNEAGHLSRTLESVGQVLAAQAAAWEVIVVDDGSTDGSADVAARWCDRSPHYRLVRLSRNFGKEAAMTAGLQAARGQAVVLMDADLQHPPQLVARMLARWRQGVDMVYAVREDRSAAGGPRDWASRLFYRLVNTSPRFRMPRDAGDFRLMDRRVVDALLALPERSRFMKGLYAWVGFDGEPIGYTPDERAGGTTRFGTLRLTAMALDAVTAFTTWPLRAVSVSGAVLAMFAFGYGGYLVLEHFVVGHAVSGWATIVVSLMFFAGIQLVSVGILGEYIARIYDEVKRRPLYLVRGEAGRGLPERGA